MKNSIDGSIEDLTLSSTTLLQSFNQLMHPRPFTPDWKETHQFSSERLLMSPLRYEDRKFYTELFTNQEVTKYTGGVLSNKQAEQNFINVLKALSVKPIKYFTWLVKEKNDKDTIGIITLIWHSHEKQQAEFGIMFTPKKHQQGYCCELIESFISYCFTTLQLLYLYSFTVHDNEVAQHILKKSNFTKIGKIPFKKHSLEGLYWQNTNNLSDTSNKITC